MSNAKSILILDDGSGTLDPLAERLGAAGYGVVVLGGADDLVQTFGATPADLVLLALSTGEAVRVCEALRNNPDGAIVPIIFIGSGQEEIRSPADALAKGGDFFYALPVDPDKVAAKVKTYIGVGATDPVPVSRLGSSAAPTPVAPAALAPAAAAPAPAALPEETTPVDGDDLPPTPAAEGRDTVEGTPALDEGYLFGDEATQPTAPPSREDATNPTGFSLPPLPEPALPTENGGDAALHSASANLLEEIERKERQRQEAQRLEDERVAEEAARQSEEAAQRQAADEAARRAAEETERLRAEEAAHQAAEAEERARAEAEARQQAEAEAQRRIEEEIRIRLETEATQAAEAQRRAEEEAAQRRADEEAAARRRSEAEALERQAEEEAAQRRAEAEAIAQRRAEEETARRRAEEETARRRAEEEAAAKRRAEEETARRRAEEETARRRADEEAAAKRRAEEETARRRAEEEAAAKRRAEEETARRRAEEEAAAKRRAEEETARRRAEEETARRRADEEAAARRKEEAEAPARRARQEEELRQQIEARLRREMGLGADAAAAKPQGRAPLPDAPDAGPESPQVRDRAGAILDVRAAPMPPVSAPSVLEGTFSPLNDLAAVLHTFFREQVTGRVDFTAGGSQKTIFFERGSPVDAYSSQLYDRMEEYLYREGKITRPQYQAVRLKKLRGGRRIGAFLVSENFLKADELFAVVRGHLEEVYMGLFEWTDGAYKFSAERALEDDRVVLGTDPRRLLVEGIRRKYLMPRLLDLVGAPSTLLGAVEGAQVGMDALGLSSDERNVVRLVDGSRNVEDLVFSSGLSALRVYQVLAALVIMGSARVLVRGIEGVDADGTSGGDAIDRERIKDKSEQVRRLDYFQILGISRSSTAYEIDRAFQRNRQEFDARHFSEAVRRELADELREIERVLEDAREVLATDHLREAYARNLAS